MKKAIYILSFIFILSSCKYMDRNKKEDAIARVYDKYLYKSDVKDIVPPNTKTNDSIAMVTSFINSWIQNEVILNKAEENLSENKKNLEKELTDYRNSLIIYEYEKELVKQKIDTTVSDEDINKYYETHQTEFELKNNIIQVVFVKLPQKSSVYDKIRRLYKSDVPQDKETLKELCSKYAVNYFLEDESWLVFDDLLKEIPIKTYNQEDYLKNHRLIEMKDSLFDYFVNIRGFKIKESVSPLNFERDNIKNIIINKRKISLIEDMRNSVFKDALKKGDFEIY